MPLTKVKSGGVSDSITLTSPDINAPDIDGGTIDNAVIGGSTAAAGSFTTITATGGSSSNWNTAYGWGDHSTQSYATQTYVGTAVSNLVDSSPAALDTLNELAAALGDDPNFATTVTNSIALKAPLANPSFTGSVNTEAVSTNSLDLQAIAESKSVTAVDVFVYDTSKDSDGGAWRHRTQHTSWYNETLNTSTRGATKKFPSVAVIVAENGSGGGVSIYDGDDPDLPLWMKFSNSSSGWNAGLIPLGGGTTNITAASAKNGQLSVSTTSTSLGLLVISFIEDMTRAYLSVNSYGGIDTAPLSLRNTTGHTFANNQAGGNTLPLLVNLNINDVAMTVLPNAPIDADTGLPVPTIAVATAGGVSVIKDDGTVVDIVSNTINHETPREVKFVDDKVFWVAGNNYDNAWSSVNSTKIPTGDITTPYYTVTTANALVSKYTPKEWNVPNHVGDLLIPINVQSPRTGGLIELAKDDELIIGGEGADDHGTVVKVIENVSNPESGMLAQIASDFATGYQVGDIKLATLSDTDDTNISASGNTNLLSGGWTNNGSFPYETFTTSGLNITSAINTTAYGAANQVWTAVAGKTYTAYFNLTLNSGTAPTLFVQTSSSWGNGVSYQTVNGANSFTFTATMSTSSYFSFSVSNGVATNFSVANLELYEGGVADRSVNGTSGGLSVFGTVTKTAVATGADLVGYSGFSSSNYLEQPTNPAITSLTSFAFTGWFKTTMTGNGYLFSLGGGSVNGRGLAVASTGGVLYTWDPANGQDLFTTVVNDGSWHQVTFITTPTTRVVYIDGVLDSTIAVSAYTTPADSQYRVGVFREGNGTINNIFDGQHALQRFSATIPTAEQIAKIYNDEKPLFQEGAQATLYGTSDAVTALAYDDDTELLHAGTSAGRSVFQGLRRVENTTDAVGSAISASNGLVAED